VPATSETVAAAPADHVSLAAYDLPGKKVGHVASHLHDLADEFVSHDHRHRNGPLRPGVPIVDVQVRAADAGLVDANEHVIDPAFGLGHVPEVQPGGGFGFDESFHLVRYVGINGRYNGGRIPISKKSFQYTAVPSKRPAPSPSPEAINEHLGRRVKRLRTERGWSLDNLAGTSGVSRSMLSEIEREKANPTLAVTFRIATAFGMTLSELVETPDSAPMIQVVRGDDRGQVFRSDRHHQIRTLSPLNLEKDVEFYEVRLKPDGALRSKPHFEGTREFLTVEKGRVCVESAGSSVELAAGDSATYRADVPHALVNLGPGEAVLFLVDIYRQGSR
jgi:transcriptional regulator with XRE-family HTH domain